MVLRAHYVNGGAWTGTSAARTPIMNPSTDAEIGEVILGNEADVAYAVEVAQKAQAAWAAEPPARRAEIMFRFRDRLLADIEPLARMLSTEHGKTLSDAKGEIQRGIEVVEFACGIAQLLKGEFSQNVAREVDTYSIRQPLGVVAGITPFNFPAMVPLWMFPIALACGNAFILKPSERDPSVPLRMAELLSSAGLPAGLFNVLNGDKIVVDSLLDHPGIDAVSFVGSTAVGEYIYKRGTAAGKRVQALCGAKNHLVVMPDADMDVVADAIIGAAYGSAGERCMAISVAVAVNDDTADSLIKTLTPRVQGLKVGAFEDPTADLGPVITKASRDRIHRYIEEGVEAGADLVVDGRVEGSNSGYFVGGCLFDNVTPEMSIYRDEIFGPVLAVVRADGYEAAVKLINEHEYGNGTAIFTKDGRAARDFVNRVKIGMVGVNVPIPVPVAYHSFGGWKRSLFGDHHIHGMEGVRFYTRMKAVTTRWPGAAREGAVFNFHAGTQTSDKA